MLNELNEIARDVFENPDVNLSETTTANDVNEWDSISHVYFMVEIEKHFKVKFTASEIQQFSNVADIMKAISAKTSSK